jgi:protocatechuate 3,4-dioxygenase alpha subunit
MREFGCTPGQTVGPFFHCALPYPGDSRLVDDDHPDAVRLHGTVYDGAGEGIPDALVELWQPGPDGNVVAQPGSLRRSDAFTGWGRCATDVTGEYSFTTLTPPSFFAITVFARGLLNRLFTRAYLPHVDPDRLPAGLDAARRDTLVCAAEPTGYRFDIHLQGQRETVFLMYQDDPR